MIDVDAYEIVLGLHSDDPSVFHVFKVNSVVFTPIAHVAVPDDEMRGRVPYLDPIGVFRADAPILDDVRVAFCSQAGGYAVRRGEITIVYDEDRSTRGKPTRGRDTGGEDRHRRRNKRCYPQNWQEPP